MKLMGFLLLPAGWIIVLTAIVLLGSEPLKAAFALAGVAVEILGLTFAVRAHPIPHGDHR